jgi:hypothetical protein
MPISLMLDYDNLEHQDVVKDCESLLKKYPALGAYVIEPSKSGRPNRWHVRFPKSVFSTFQEAYDIALESGADPDWLDLCKQYECFGLETEMSRRSNQAREEKHPIVNRPTRNITSPIILNLKPATALDARRIVKVCEAIKDPTWKYTAFLQVWNLEHHVLIGCTDEAQAIRRMKWLSEQGLGFTATIEKPVENSQTQSSK